MVSARLNFKTATKPPADIVYKIAETREEREAAFRLVYQAYLRSGLGTPNQYEQRVTPYHLLPTTDTFIAVYKGEVISTVSLVVDGELGLPMESIYPDEVAARREKGLRVAEISCLADRRRDFRRFFPVFLQLCRLMAQSARQRGIDELLVAVHPKHARFYRRFMSFETTGKETVYPLVQNRPAVALSLNFAKVDQQDHSDYRSFVGSPLSAEQLEPRPISLTEREYFRPIAAASCGAEVSLRRETSGQTSDAELSVVAA